MLVEVNPDIKSEPKKNPTESEKINMEHSDSVVGCRGLGMLK